MSKRGLLVITGLVTGLLAVPGEVLAQQTDYSAGKSAPQLFSSDCSACHQSPKGLAKSRDQRGLSDFLREHYTTRPENAGALAAYLLGNPGTAAPIRNPIEASEPRGRRPRGTPASAPAAAPDAAPATRPAAAEEDPFRRIFGLGQSEPEQKPIVAPEPGEESAAKPDPKGKGKPKPHTAARPAAEPAARAGKDEPKDTAKETPKETSKSRKAEQATEAARDATKAEDAAKEAAAKEAAAKEAAAKAEAARVRAYATSGDEARPKETAPVPAATPAVEKPATPPG